MSKLNQHVKSDKVKWIITGIALVLILAILGGVLAAVLTETNPKDWFEQPAGEETETPDVTDGDGNEMESGKVYPMPSSMIFATTAAESGITIKATVEPADATNKSLTWSVEWVNPSSSWANGKNVSEYISLARNGQDTATVSCLKPFGEQAKIVVTSDSNPEAKAECTLDYKQRITGIGAIEYSGVGENNGEIANFGNVGSVDDISIYLQNNAQIVAEWSGNQEGNAAANEFGAAALKSSVYTIANDDKAKIVSFSMPSIIVDEGVGFIDNVLSALDVLGIGGENRGFFADAVYKDSGLNNDLLSYGSLLIALFGTDYSEAANYYSDIILFYESVMSGEYDLTPVVEAMGGLEAFMNAFFLRFEVSAGGYTEVYYAAFDVSFIEILVESITLDNESVVF